MSGETGRVGSNSANMIRRAVGEVAQPGRIALLLQAAFTINVLGPRARARVDANDSRDVRGTHTTRATHRMSLATCQDRLHMLIMHTSTCAVGHYTTLQILQINTVITCQSAPSEAHKGSPTPHARPSTHKAMPPVSRSPRARTRRRASSRPKVGRGPGRASCPAPNRAPAAHCTTSTKKSRRG